MAVCASSVLNTAIYFLGFDYKYRCYRRYRRYKERNGEQKKMNDKEFEKYLKNIEEDQ